MILRPRLLSVAVFIVSITSSLLSQGVGVSVSNQLRYGSGREAQGPFSAHRDYLENLTETRITISDFLVGFRLLYDAPPEYGVEFTGIRKRYLEFRRDDLTIRAGNSFSLYGRGLALNLFENRGLAFDTGLDGIKMEYTTRVFRLAATAGDIQYRDVLNLARVENYRVRAGSVELTPYPFLSVGASIVSGIFSLPPPSFPDLRSQFDIPEYYVRFSVCGALDGFVSYAEKRTTTYGDPSGTHRGTGCTGSLTYTSDQIGVSFEYKDYRFGIADPYDRNLANRAHKAYAFQNPPIVHKEHTFTLASRYPHIIDFNDEVGFQTDVFYTVGQLTGSLNFSAASRHYSFSPTGDTNAIFQPIYGSMARTSSFWPTLDPKFSPFWEVYGEAQYFLEEGGNDYVLVAFNRRSMEIAEELFVNPAGGPVIEATRLTGVPLSAQYTLSGDWVVKAVLERQWVYDATNSSDPSFTNQLISLGVSQSPTYSVTIRYEFTSDKGTVDGRKDWTALDLGFRLGTKHNITLTIGGDRGGQICANGVCRVVNPFLGVRAGLVSYL